MEEDDVIPDSDIDELLSNVDQNPNHPAPPREVHLKNYTWATRNFVLWQPSILFRTVFYPPHRLRGRVIFGAGSEGPVGLAHGGAIAAYIDQFMGLLTAVMAVRAFTVSLQIDFKRGVPLRTLCHTEAWVAEKTGRKLYIRAQVTSEDGHEFVTARGLFLEARSKL